MQLGKNASDCAGALLINDTAVGPVFSPPGFGNKLEIYGYELGDPIFIQREHNTVWYKFRAPYDAVFTFDLIPELKDDDFDFLLFRYDGPNFCRDVADGTKIPLRTNISRKNTIMNGRTGLSETAVDDFVPSGPGSPYSRALKVKGGDVLYLLVDNPFRENEGHSIHLHWRKTEKKDEGNFEVDESKTAEYRSPIRKLQINVIDKETDERVASNISIDGLPDSLNSVFSSVSEVTLNVVSYRTYEINVVKKGYLLAYETFIPKNDSLYNITIPIKKMELGDRINLTNIKFDSDKTDILDKSKPALKQLGRFLEENPGIHIEIQGHVNGESKRNKRKYRKLSKARAKAIYEALTERGIDASRLNFVGVGNAEMIYPTPVNNRQAEANRRVEAEVTKL
ncbi:MAG: OmpA family protein [Cryomorphaceae bacterium]|nr:OmpA family protein [Flavobacteriales bacterium]